MKIIDAHQHFWDQRNDTSEGGPFNYSWTKSLPPLNKTYLPEDLKPLLEAAGVHQSIFVQTQHNLEENHWVLKLAEANDFIAAVVGWVDLAADDVEDQILAFKDHPKFVGVRHVTQDEPDVDFQIRPAVMNGMKMLAKHGLTYDLLFFTKHLRHCVKLGTELPELKMVVDHISKPRIKAGWSDPTTETWKQDMKNAASFPNIYCKLSGMITEADHQNWTPQDLKPYIAHTIDCFGFDRLMFGSDWPVSLLAGSYQQMFDGLQEALGDISDSDREKLFSGTACAFYGIS